MRGWPALQARPTGRDLPTGVLLPGDRKAKVVYHKV